MQSMRKELYGSASKSALFSFKRVPTTILLVKNRAPEKYAKTKVSGFVNFEVSRPLHSLALVIAQNSSTHQEPFQTHN